MEQGLEIGRHTTTAGGDCVVQRLMFGGQVCSLQIPYTCHGCSFLLSACHWVPRSGEGIKYTATTRNDTMSPRQLRMDRTLSRVVDGLGSPRLKGCGYGKGIV